MDDNITPISRLFEKVEDYTHTTVELFKLNTIEKSADVVSSLVSHLVIFAMVVLSFLILNIGLALWLGKLLGDSFFGFFIMGGFYTVFTVLIYLFRHQWIKYPISNSIIKKMIEEKVLET